MPSPPFAPVPARRPRCSVPDIRLPRLGGGTVELGCLAGHNLVLLYCPEDPTVSTTAIATYSRSMDELVGYDAWLVAACSEPPISLPTKDCPAVGIDDGSAWEKLTTGRSRLDRQRGATFLFGRGGALQRVWDGVADVLAVIGELDDRGIDTSAPKVGAHGRAPLEN